jgi:hypothetical protein
MAELPSPPEGMVLTHFIVSDDVERSRRFYTEVLEVGQTTDPQGDWSPAHWPPSTPTAESG